jgi:hypothetical protein
MTLLIWMKKWNVELAPEEAQTREPLSHVLDEVGSL